MTNSELTLFIGNRLSNLYVTLERLLQNNNPRGLFNDYEDSISEITQLQELESSPGFLTFYVTEIKRQADALKNTEVYPVASQIAEFSSPSLLNDEKSYIIELIAGRSRKKTKSEYLAKVKDRMVPACSLVQAYAPGDTVDHEIKEFEIFLNEQIALLTT
jgi:hypothetical protein